MYYFDGVSYYYFDGEQYYYFDGIQWSPLEDDKEQSSSSLKLRHIALLIAILLCCTTLLQMLGRGGGAATASPTAHFSQAAQQLSSSSPSPSSSSVLGPPSLSASFIDQVLSYYGSPAVGLGQRLYDDSLASGIDDAWALAFFRHESSFGTTGEARATMALGNERCIQDRPCIDQDRGGYAQMYSWADGADHWYALINNLYVKEWGRTTVETIIPKYAPGSDGNNEQGYINAVEGYVAAWRAGRMY